MNSTQFRPLLVLTGPTASGKSSLAMKLAQVYDGEIICADSRTVYKGMDIGTAKPSKHDQKKIRHHLLDIVEPNEKFTVYDFQRLARNAIEDIYSRGRIPFLVGGTGLYIDSVILDYELGREADESLRKELEELSIDTLQKMIIKQRLVMPNNMLNKRHLIRCIENAGYSTSRKSSPDGNVIVVAISTEKSELLSKISFRIEGMLTAGIIPETEKLLQQYGNQCEAMKGNIYSLVQRYVQQELSLDELKEQAKTQDWHLAKRQLTWLRRHDFVHWQSIKNAESFIGNALDEQQIRDSRNAK